MVIDVKRINGFGGRPVFEKAIFQAPFRYNTDLLEEDRACFFYMIRGRYKTHSNVDKLLLNPRDGVVKRCGSYISEFLGTVKTDKCEAIAIYFYPDVFREIYHETPAIFNKKQEGDRIQKITSNQLIDKYIESLLFYFENPSLVDEALVKLKLQEIVMLLLKTDKYDSVLELITDLFNPNMVSFRKIVNSHLYSEITLDELAHLCSMSLSTFKREFNKAFDESPARFLKLKKLEKAAHLLSVSNESITQIAFESGFGNSTRFSTVFKEYFGMSPKNYRLSQNKNS